jgi:hypothetical protein
MNHEMPEAQATQVSGFLQTVCRITDAHRSAKKLYAHRFAPDYNALDVIGLNEWRLSKMLARLLDPCETHVQGNRLQ